MEKSSIKIYWFVAIAGGYLCMVLGANTRGPAFPGTSCSTS
jgi:hypothetical protein